MLRHGVPRPRTKVAPPLRTEPDSLTTAPAQKGGKTTAEATRALEDGRSRKSPGLTFGPIYTATLIDPAAQSQRLAQQLSIEMPPLEDGNPALHARSTRCCRA